MYKRQVADVPAESWIMTLLPYLLVFGAMFIPVSYTHRDVYKRQAQEILGRVLLDTGGYAMDDMTVVAIGIWEK